LSKTLKQNDYRAIAVRPEYRDHGVLGASTFPNADSANPTPTILALTYRTADAIFDRYLKKPALLA
jgi:predicted CoA-binding protein